MEYKLVTQSMNQNISALIIVKACDLMNHFLAPVYISDIFYIRHNRVLWNVVSQWYLIAVFRLNPRRSWRAPQAMRSPAQLRPSCHAPHTGCTQQGVVVLTKNRVWEGKNSQGRIDSECVMFMAAVVIVQSERRGMERGRTGSWLGSTHTLRQRRPRPKSFCWARDEITQKGQRVVVIVTWDLGRCHGQIQWILRCSQMSGKWAGEHFNLRAQSEELQGLDHTDHTIQYSEWSEVKKGHSFQLHRELLPDLDGNHGQCSNM